MDPIAENILSDLKKEVLREVTREKASRFSRIVKNESSAKNYAKAMFDIASDIGKIEVIKSDLNVVYSSLLVDNDIFNFFKSSFIDGHLRMRILKKIYADKILEETFNLIAILVERDMINILFAIIVEYENLCNEYYNIIVVKITTASNMTDTEDMNKLKDHITNMISDKDIHFTFNIDENIIGGVVIEVEDVVYDYSVRRLLTELKSSISENN
ncbi:ATP synthase F1 subunit delta [Brachyspira hyodysenteriae]|uniref:ATP synthase subunit delta 2 n=2 Tax=Brachyspira hyodysenteriae TaxID=159 RepID=ATPD2_BRAHW|nr:ATP synthase F1 subunit delta [Brachyspira hyodysenteriae]C0QW64.1 RecName: Full=ATP synthase subunit delta 2; AltName: Full=ATP synthase F(1) sector subunit delta 2; AltName: Full=F-type ATPase subunit delta 2; Short=F-ATPase subunit delta 2 [Brachyspira hyodysenteriae WA1]ACN84650.1 F0F1-type ATP synthase, delta subunit [Brachyspira hyodysenteriae WA1]ANN63275.1 ATP synthase F1 subunit delta [Brachyspira hyodysenteriae ATCC 27164]AUJ50385.1 ATP synthase subunit delta 2 [Brachyspira hyodyse